MMGEKDLLELYVNEFDRCVAISKECFEKYGETRDERWKDDGIAWVLKASKWKDLAREDLVFIV